MPQNSSNYAKAREKTEVKLMISFFVVVGLILGYWSYISHRSADAMMDKSGKVAMQFITDLSSHNYQSATSLLSEQARSINPPNTLSALVTLEEQRHGSWTGVTQKSFEPVNLYGLKLSKLGYDVKFQNGHVTLHITLIRSNSSWKVDAFWFDM